MQRDILITGPVLRHGDVPADVVAVEVHPRPGLGHDEGPRRPRYHLAEQGGAAAGGHVDEGHLAAVGGVAHLRRQPVEGPVRQDDELLGRQELQGGSSIASHQMSHRVIFLSIIFFSQELEMLFI